MKGEYSKEYSGLYESESQHVYNCVDHDSRDGMNTAPWKAVFSQLCSGAKRLIIIDNGWYLTDWMGVRMVCHAIRIVMQWLSTLNWQQVELEEPSPVHHIIPRSYPTAT